MSIRLRISLAFTILFLMTVGVTYALHVFVDSMAAAIEVIASRDVATMATAENLQVAFLSQIDAIRGLVRRPNSTDLATVGDDDRTIMRSLSQARRFADTKSERNAIDDLAEVYRDQREDAEAVADASVAGRQRAARSAASQVDEHFERTIELSQRLMVLAHDDALAHAAYVVPLSRTAHDVSVAATPIAGSVSLVLSLLIVLSIVRPLRKMTDGVNAIRAGDLSARTRVTTRDELGAFSEILDSTLDRLGEERTRLADANRALESEHRRSEEELDLARKVQLELLPKPHLASERYDVAAVFRPAGWVGGDFYRLIRRNGGLRLVVGDVAGKGVPAALAMAAASALLEDASQRESRPEGVLALVDAVLSTRLGLSPELFVTVLIVDWDLESARLTYSIAGHPMPLILDHAGEAHPLSGRVAPPLAASEGTEFYRNETSLGQGDRLIAFTDGLIELRDSRGEILGEEALAQAAIRHHGLHGVEMAEAMVTSLESASTGRRDDETLVVLEVLPS